MLESTQPLATHQGSFEGTSGQATLTGGSDPGWAGTQEGSVLLLAYTVGGGSLATPAGFVRATPTPGGTAPNGLYWKVAAAGETSWTVTSSIGGPGSWYVEEWEAGTLDPDFPVDVVPTTIESGTSGTATSDPTPQSTTYDGAVYVLHAAYASASTTPPGLSGHTGGQVEVANVPSVGATKAARLSVSRQFTRQLGVFQSAVTVSPSSAWGVSIVVLTAAGARRQVTLKGFRDHCQRTFAGATAGQSGATLASGAVNPEFVDHALLGPAVKFAMANDVRSLSWTGSASLGAPAANERALVWSLPVVFDTLPTTDLDVTSGGLSGSTLVKVRYRAASGRLTLQIGSDTEVEADVVVQANTRYDLDVRAFGPGTAWTVDWRVNGATQPRATGTGSAALIASTLRVGATVDAATGTLVCGPIVWSFQGGHYPLGRWRFAVLLPDQAVTPTVQGTVGSFALITANATGATLTSGTLTQARDAIRELPPTVGATQDGVCQRSTAAADYLEFPLEGYTPAADELVRNGNVYLLGWGAGTAPVAASLGVRGWDGSSETALLGTPAAPTTAHGFGNSITDPSWYVARWNPAGGWTAAKIAAAAIRLGWSDDATPDVGVLLAMLVLAMQETEAQQVFGNLVTASVAPDSEGIQVLHIDTTGTPGGVLYYTIGGSETRAPPTGTFGPDEQHTEAINALDFPTIQQIRWEANPELAQG
jgi:hypothetical protein